MSFLQSVYHDLILKFSTGSAKYCSIKSTEVDML